MSTTGRTASGSSGVVETLGSAGFVHVVAARDGDSLAAVGLLGRAFGALGTPFQVSAVASRDAARERFGRVPKDDAALSVGVPTEDALSLDADGPRSVAAYDVVRRLAPDAADPALAIAGGLSTGWTPQGSVLDDADVSRRPGLGLPVADLADGLAHSTLLSGPFSGDEGMAGALLAELELPAELDDAAHRRLASRVALDVTEGAPPSAADALSRVLRPHVADAPVATLEGYADVLDTVARTDPGLGVAFALSHADHADVLDAWRNAATRSHAAVRAADPARYSGLVAVECPDADPGIVARLVRDFVADDPAALAVGDDIAALAVSDGDARDRLGDIVDAGTVGGTERVATTTNADDDLARVLAGGDR